MSLRERLEARRALAERATPGPWKWDDINSDLIAPLVIEREYGDFGSVLSSYPKPVLVGVYAPDDDDIAHMAANDPTTITLMLDALDMAAQVQAIDRELHTSASSEFWSRLADLYERLDVLAAHMEREAGE